MNKSRCRRDSTKYYGPNKLVKSKVNMSQDFANAKVL